MKPFIEIDGKKYQADEKGEALKDAQGNMIPYTESPQQIDPANVDLDELAKVNPHVARMLAEKAEADKKIAEAQEAEDARKRKEAEEKGEWQKLADEADAKRKAAEAEAAKAKALVGNDKSAVDGVVHTMLKDIPDEKKALIPAQFNSRQKLEYITTNAKFLGINVANNKGGGVPPNENEPNLDEEGKVRKEFEELRLKQNKTPTEEQHLLELAKKLKELQSKTK